MSYRPVLNNERTNALRPVLEYLINNNMDIIYCDTKPVSAKDLNTAIDYLRNLISWYDTKEATLAREFPHKKFAAYMYYHAKRKSNRKSKRICIAFRGVIDGMSPREKDIMLSYCGLSDSWPSHMQPPRLADIAHQYGVGDARIGQIIRKALRKLRHPSRYRPLLDAGFAKVFFE